MKAACGLKYRQQTMRPGHPLALQLLQQHHHHLHPAAAAAGFSLYSTPHGLLHPQQQQPGYSVYCCPPPPFSFPTSGFYAQDSPSRGHSFKAKGAGKSKRMRTSFTNEQLSRLEKEFSRQQYTVGSERFVLASALHLTEAQVKVWFQNRRIKWRKQSLEQQQAKLAKLGLAAPPPPPPHAASPGSQGHGGEEDDFSSSSDVDVDVDVSDDSVDLLTC
ncbi:hypothetical protein CRUP_016396 [Coryphaenoides rupestris]|nr:hypothetical protein CRUP_016396 [Coryphaenoides rupestris]